MSYFDDIEVQEELRVGDTIIKANHYQSKDLCFNYGNGWSGDSYVISKSGFISLKYKKTDLKPSGIMSISHPLYILRVQDGEITEAYERSKDIDLIPDDMLGDYKEIEWK